MKRLGQKAKEIHIYDFVVRNTVEAEITQEHKAAVDKLHAENEANRLASDKKEEEIAKKKKKEEDKARKEEEADQKARLKKQEEADRKFAEMMQRKWR